ncbi:MAG TPA: AMP-binding protein, partial [Propionibacteriaceae bacterium]
MDSVDERSALYREHGWWRDGLVIDDLRAHAISRADDIASVTYSTDGGWVDRLTFGEMAAAVDSIAAGLLDLGVQVGEPVCFQLPNWWYFNAVHLACDKIGAVSCPLIPILRRREVEHIVRQVRARVYIGPRRFRGFDFQGLGHEVRDAVDTLEHVFTIEGPRGAGGSFEEHFLGREGSSIPVELFEQRRPAVEAVKTIQFTSGTTGEPKGVMHTHNSLNAATKLAPLALGLDSDDVIMMPSPLAHASGFIYGCLMPTTYAMKVVYQDIWEAGRMLELIDAEGGTWTIGSTPFVMDTIRVCREQSRDAAPL